MLELIQPRRAREDWLKKPRQFLLAWLRPSHQSPSQASGRRLTQLAPNFSRNSHQENTNCDSVRSGNPEQAVEESQFGLIHLLMFDIAAASCRPLKPFPVSSSLFFYWLLETRRVNNRYTLPDCGSLEQAQ